MALKIAGHLFTGPSALATTVVRRNQKLTAYAIVAKVGEAWDPGFQLIAVGKTDETGMIFAEHPQRAAWERVNPGASVYLLSADDDTAPGEVAERIRARYDLSKAPLL